MIGIIGILGCVGQAAAWVVVGIGVVTAATEITFKELAREDAVDEKNKQEKRDHDNILKAKRDDEIRSRQTLSVATRGMMAEMCQKDVTQAKIKDKRMQARREEQRNNGTPTRPITT